MSQENEFDSICPYNDEEAVKALNKVTRSRLISGTP